MAGGGVPGHSMGGGHGMAGMGGMGDMAGFLGADAGDVQYPLFLINGRPPTDPGVIEARPGQRLRLRLVNVGSDRPFRVAVGGHRLTITHSDGYPVDPVTVDAVLLEMGERYDVVVTAADGVFPIVAVPEGTHTGALAVLRTGAGEAPPPDVRPVELDRRLLSTADLHATAEASLQDRAADRVLAVRLEGDMQSYRLTLNGKRFDPADPWAGALEVREGERVRLSFENATMMFHPHLHGHTFQLRGRRLDGARKDTVIVRPMEMVTGEFDAANPGQWALHCHNAYHPESGMTAVVSYVA
jgi:multicopper oxidase